MKIHIVGDGVFGKFLRELLADQVEFDPAADTVLLAVPESAYAAVAAEYAGRHLVNVCSVQRDTNMICRRHSDRVTGLHPMFGPRSPEDGRTAVLTIQCDETKNMINIFEQKKVAILTQLPDGREIDGDVHDRMMAATHLAGLRMSEQLRSVVAAADWVPDACVPTSFKKIRETVEQCGDFSPGTLQSMRANPYADSEKFDTLRPE